MKRKRKAWMVVNERRASSDILWRTKRAAKTYGCPPNGRIIRVEIKEIAK